MKNRILTFAFFLLGALAFVSCQKDNTEDGVSISTDELAYLQGHFASVDEEGVLNIWAGWQLNEADPDYHYFGLYNKYSGKLRIFYYITKENMPVSDANDHMWVAAFDKSLQVLLSITPRWINCLAASPTSQLQ